jgi:hypothetical protein
MGRENGEGKMVGTFFRAAPPSVSPALTCRALFDLKTGAAFELHFSLDKSRHLW